MKIIKKLVIVTISAAFMLSSAATVLADETAATTAETTAAATAETTASGNSSTTDISKMTFATMYGSQLPKYLNRQYVFDGKKIPVAESNYYFLLTFMQLSQYAAYGYLPSTADKRIDLDAAYGTTGQTCADYLVDQAEKYIHSTYILMKRATDAGLALTEEDKQSVDKDINDMYEQQAKPSGLTLDKCIKIYFGSECDEKAYRLILENSALAGKYQKKYIEEYAIPEDQKMIPNITYALHYAPASSATEDEKKKANDAAQEMLKQCKNIDDLKTIGGKAKEDGICKDAGTVPVQKGKMVPAFEAWAWDSARKEGEMAVIYSDEYGYFCVGYNGKVELDAGEKQDMANKALSDDIEKDMTAGTYGFKNEGTVAANKGNTVIIVFICVVVAAIIAVVAVYAYNNVKSRKPVIKTGKSSTSSKKGSSKSGSGKKPSGSKGSGSKSSDSKKSDSKKSESKSSDSKNSGSKKSESKDTEAKDTDSKDTDSKESES